MFERKTFDIMLEIGGIDFCDDLLNVGMNIAYSIVGYINICIFNLIKTI